MATKKEVSAPKEETTALATVAPDFMRQDAGKGVENLNSSDLEIPRLILLQSLSKQVTEGDEKAGTFYHTILEQAIGEKGKPVRIVPIYSDTKYILWKPRHEGGGILARAEDGVHWNPPNAKFTVKPYDKLPKQVVWETKPTVEESGLDKFGSSDPDDPNSQPAAVKMLNYVVVLPDFPELGPMVLTFQRGSIKTGAKFGSKIKFEPNAPSFGQIFEMSASIVDTGSGDFFFPTVTRVGFVSEVDEYNNYKGLYENFKKMGVKIRDIEGTQDDGGDTKSKAKTQTPEGGIDL